MTDEILKTGYKQLIENSSFKIDNIDNINLQNLKVNTWIIFVVKVFW